MKDKLRIKDLHIKEDGTKCVYCDSELDLENCVIAHMDNNPKNNADWNHALAHQQCNIDAIDNFDYHLKAQERIKLNHSKIYSPRIEIKNSEYGTLIARIIQLSSKMGYGWGSKRHHLVKQGVCPHCKKRIQHRFQRIGELKDGKYNIEHYGIEDGVKGYTSIMYADKVWWVSRWSNQEIKDKLRISLEGEN